MDIIKDIATLRRRSKEVGEDDDLDELYKQMAEVLTRYRGVGLAAIQIGVSKRAILISAHPDRPGFFITNPIITKERGSQVRKEGCLSLPGVELVLKRPQMVTIKGINQYHNHVKYKFSGLEASIACHECDHLDGVLIIDKGKEPE